VGYDSGIKSSYDLKNINKQIDSFLNDLQNCERPCLLIGGGVRLSGAANQLLELGRKLKIPMFPTWNALDVVCSDYEYYGGRVGTYGGAGRNFGIQNSDLLLAIGSRLSGRITGGNINTFARGAKKYMVDVDKDGLQQKLQQVQFDECVYSDAGLFIDLLMKRLELIEIPSFGDWTDKVMGWKEKYDPVTQDMYVPRKYPHPYVFMRMLSEEMTANDVFVADCGGNIVISNHAFETKTGQRYFTNNGISPFPYWV
jgi:acetolactate synthase-1/2/3 large subunit